jgi:methionyl-tRNA formyltransferase
MSNNISILFLGKADDPYCAAGLKFCQQNSDNVTACLGAKWGAPLPDEAKNWEGDLIISYLSRWVVPTYLLERAKLAAINFHPASPDYPGIGCNNFALYNEAEEYGATCHHMAPKVDTGGLIKVSRFAVFPGDTVESILARTYTYQLALFYDVLSGIFRGEPLPDAGETWTRKPYSRKEFDDLMTITPDMSAEEVARRVRACDFGDWQPSIKLHGFTFKHAPKKK